MVALTSRLAELERENEALRVDRLNAAQALVSANERVALLEAENRQLKQMVSNRQGAVDVLAGDL